ncbi:MAG: hypothetical protein HOH19_10905 [Kordiimonadaceae bacterium]|nr:hypothetical protein [Kordiimonadaceae bacterium]MBT6033076.1 hypothetical protein [Kordiimonadaceae bacterium]
MAAFIMLPGFSVSVTAQESQSDSYVFLKAVKDQDYGKVKSYLQRGANINTRGYDDGETAVYIAAKLRDSILMTFLMDGKANTDVPIKSTGETALMVAVRLRAREVMDMLITSNADVNKGDRNGETALYKAVQGNDRASVKRLLAANADWSIADNTGRTPMDLTLENRRLRQLTRVLTQAGAEY